MLLGSPIHKILSGNYMFGASFDPSDRALAIEAVAHSERNLSEFDFQARHRKPDGNEIWLRFRAVPRRVGDKTVWDGLMLDVTRDREISLQLQNAKEAAEAGERAMAYFLATLSH
jgi:PAS domain-containing protein